MFGGGVALRGAAFLDAVAAAFRAEALPPLRDTPILPGAARHRRRLRRRRAARENPEGSTR
ncbi:hypothetical protein BJF79_21890 [Actinomadura sp. CNU-125]|nr:hypothetical protein BJF79_21890 [Actinomadura sp. CNU-125]